ncbi:MAG TPA: thioredoxin family protein [Chondromyces sp.]|nr:thioredoxin family protein [Chondromyces sp.]
MMSVENVSSIISSKDQVAVYAYTPMCGTCQVAGKMVDVIEQILKGWTIVKIDLNYYEPIAVKYEVESVPCLLIFKDGVLQDRIYAFQSVPHLYEKLRAFS